MVSFESVKRMMGWCPNVGAMEARNAVQFENLAINTPNNRGKRTHRDNGWWNKYHNRVLMELLLLMYLAVFTFDEYGKVNLDMYLIGAISGLFFHFLMGMNDWHRFNKAACRGSVQPQTTRKQKAITFLVIISLIAFVVFLVTNITGGMAFVSGTMLFVWIKILGVLYWEQKNGKTLIIHKISFFAVDINTLRTE
ncbi:hypothetical protein LI82_06760 [Methanococcoides methylutens]|uniref:DUF1673 domain-containing protein n=1 Tax=Methanococcoides methylutens TaxID=2226 RepID=A0A099T094_METMT|nr:DUF1673 family protein [Methanococcoides methylutens]KGK98567.1 hypothetical protein LI82_06760 [Methanococcoides methylutens]